MTEEIEAMKIVCRRILLAGVVAALLYFVSLITVLGAAAPALSVPGFVGVFVLMCIGGLRSSTLGRWSQGPEDLQVTTTVCSTNRTAGRGRGPGQVLPPHCHVVDSFERRTGIDGRDCAVSSAIRRHERRRFPACLAGYRQRRCIGSSPT
jgi:hypothetical protein